MKKIIVAVIVIIAALGMYGWFGEKSANAFLAIFVLSFIAIGLNNWDGIKDEFKKYLFTEESGGDEVC